MFFTPLSVKLFRYYYGLGNDYNYYIKKPRLSGWYKVKGLEDDLLVLEAGRFPLKRISALIVSYKSGELLEEWGKADSMPGGVIDIRNSGINDERELTLDRLELDGTVLEVKHFANRKHPRSSHYITEITNKSGSPLQVLKFGGYEKSRERLLLSTVTDSLYSQEQFNEWFNVQNKGWIEPGETVRDPNNYGSGDAYWVYFCQNREGERFIVGNRMPLIL